MIKDSHPTGSRYICNPPPTDTDNDTIYLLEPGTMANLVDARQAGGWEIGGSGDGKSQWLSLKRDDDNDLFTEDEDYYKKFVLATEVAKRLNLLQKADRIMLFEAICYGVKPF